MASYVAQGIANFTSYNETIDDNGQLNILAVWNGINLQQTVPTNYGPGVLWFTPSITNFTYSTDFTQLTAEDLIVKTISSVSQ